MMVWQGVFRMGQWKPPPPQDIKKEGEKRGIFAKMYSSLKIVFMSLLPPRMVLPLPLKKIDFNPSPPQADL